ncbi:hypothetical protein KCG44_04290 [Pacificimonas sp. WHA3]|uniref:PEP-CTERM protein-sorting domain-containing protein n=1 Tax=Pacificimonas pallii TaxID=2827236 RepID=A0ABS6SDJ8_9SPHN|nr:hypothetical protein [Pacificimonas pallii]MBV7256001.1 hypothetical protein [Pacificimonas pallii]
MPVMAMASKKDDDVTKYRFAFAAGMLCLAASPSLAQDRAIIGAAAHEQAAAVPNPVPAPAIFGLLALGIIGLGVLHKRG